VRPDVWISTWSSGETGPVAFVTFEPQFVNEAALSEIDRLLLTVYGLPDSAAPYLSFDNSPGMLAAARSAGFAPEGTEAFLEIGSNGSGDPICLRASDGAVLYLNHDDGFGAVLINSSVAALAEFLLLFRHLIREALAAGGPDAYLDGDLPPDAVERTVAAMQSVDPAALGDGTMWPTELHLA